MNRLKKIFNHLWENTSNSFIDSNTKKFVSQYFSLDGNHKYQTTLHTEVGSDDLIKCDGFMWDSKIIKFVEIKEENSNYNLYNSKKELILENKNLIDILTKIESKFKIEDYNINRTKCSEFTTNSNFLSNLNEPEIFKNAMKIDESDIFYIENTKNFIIKSKNLLYFESKIMIIENIIFNNNKITYLKLKPYITQINVNEKYDYVLKKLFDVIATKINGYLKSDIIKVLPFIFYHIHIIKVKDEHKILLNLHVAHEDKISKPFNYKKNKYNYKNLEDLKKSAMREHNHILLLDLDNIDNIDLYSIQQENIEKITKDNLMFNFTIGDNFGYLKYSLFGNIIGHLSYFNDTNNPMNITLEKPIPFIWFQKISIYEYIIGKMLVLLNFEKLSQGETGKKFIDHQFNTTLIWEDVDSLEMKAFESFGEEKTKLEKDAKETKELNNFLIEKIKDFHNQDEEILSIYNEIENLEKDYLKCENCISDKTKCGHMIMSYFLYDPIEIEEVNEIRNLYGGTI